MASNLSIRVSITLAMLLAALVHCAAAAPASVTVQEYRAQLQNLLSAVEQRDAYDLQTMSVRLPSQWRVKAQDRDVVVPTDWLRFELERLLHRPPDARQDVVQRLQRMLSDLDGYVDVPPDRGSERRALASILARREFSAVRGPGWFDRLKQRIATFLKRMLDRIFGSSSFPVVASIAVYVLVGLAILVTALWVYRTLAAGRSQPVVPEHVPISAKAWTVWLNEAREAAEAARWRDAVRLAYWAGISYLESRGMWPPDRARTPREYLRLLPAASEHRDTLTALTRTFEPVWYGNRPADAGTFSNTVAFVERFGAVDHPASPQPAGTGSARLAGS